jgi:hypothetical protein
MLCWMYVIQSEFLLMVGLDVFVSVRIMLYFDCFFVRLIVCLCILRIVFVNVWTSRMIV